MFLLQKEKKLSWEPLPSKNKLVLKVKKGRLRDGLFFALYCCPRIVVPVLLPL